MQQAFKIVSAVDYVVEAPQVWSDRMSRDKFAESIPRLRRASDGSDVWAVDGKAFPLSAVAQVGALLNDRNDAPRTWAALPKAGYDPAARLHAMDQAGIDYSVLNPSLAGFSGERFGAIDDSELELACVQAYNDWLIEEWAATSSRFIPQCLVPLAPVESTVKEIHRAVARGHRGVIFPAEPIHRRNLPHLNSEYYNPVWAACQELDVPLCFHAGSAPELQFPIAPTLAPELAAACQSVARPASAVFDLTNILFSRILLRFPKLKVVFAESTIGWGTFLLEYADHQYEQDHCNYPLKPSEMFHRQCYLTTWYDDVKINARHVGIENILWASNFPAANSNWPESRQVATKCLAGMSDADRQRILSANAAKLYKIDGSQSSNRELNTTPV